MKGGYSIINLSLHLIFSLFPLLLKEGGKLQIFNILIPLLQKRGWGEVIPIQATLFLLQPCLPFSQVSF